LRDLDPANVKEVLQPVRTFLAKYSPKSLKPITCTKDTSLHDAVALMLRGRVHRSWIVENDRPVACLSMTDVCARIFADLQGAKG